MPNFLQPPTEERIIMSFEAEIDARLGRLK